MASTSLLLMRPIKFLHVNKVYSYLSPHIEYFHGRHLAYGTVALLCTVSIVIGLPLLLTLEPFLNHKINFTKIKPLLDQFQGFYKDKYRCFAGYYMICRLLIITIVIANASNGFIASYILITVCGVIALIHLLVKPYTNKVLNKYDSIILHLIIFVAVLPLIDDSDSSFNIAIAFILAILPLLIFIAIALFLHKDCLKRVIIFKKSKNKLPSNTNANNTDYQKTPMKEFNIIVDDSTRKTVTICDM